MLFLSTTTAYTALNEPATEVLQPEVLSLMTGLQDQIILGKERVVEAVAFHKYPQHRTALP